MYSERRRIWTMDQLESHLCRAVLGVRVQEIIGRYHCRYTWDAGRQCI